MSENNFSSAYSDDGFWEKAKDYAKVAGENVLEPALKMYYAALDAETPAWAKAAIVGALGYFISPIDAIPDVNSAAAVDASLNFTRTHMKFLNGTVGKF